MIQFDEARFDYAPYPVCYVQNIFTTEMYHRLAGSYPDVTLFRFMAGSGRKFSLSEKNNAPQYNTFLNGNADWAAFYRSVKDAAFVARTLEMFKAHHVDLNLDPYRYTQSSVNSRGIVARLRNQRLIRTRFEFSMMPADGGSIIPHTDAAHKLITFVLSFSQPGEWCEDWGGGTAVVMPKDQSLIFNRKNTPLGFGDVHTIRTYPLQPNQAVVFVKTFNSWHCVWPMTGPSSALRKTVTINIESVA